MNYLLLAMRNVIHFKRKSIIVGVLISISIIMMIIGNSIIDTSISTLKAGFTEVLSGEIVVRARTGEDITLFGRMEDSVLAFLGYRDVFGNDRLPTLPAYDELTGILSGNDTIHSFTPILSGNALLSDNLEEAPGLYSSFFGIEPASYYRMFGSRIQLIKGSLPTGTNRGLLLSETSRRTVHSLFHFPMDVGMHVRLLSTGSAAVKIRELDVKGVYTFKNTRIRTFNQINLVNAELLRDILGVGGSGFTEGLVAVEDRALMERVGDALLDDLIIDDVVTETDDASLLDELTTILGENRGKPVLENRGWHFLLIRLQDPGKQHGVITALNREFRARGIEAEAISWEKAAGSFFTLFGITRIAMNTFIAILLIVIIFILMNTMIISIVERTNELGTMRALGARKSFIMKMFAAETLVISTVFGLLGSFLSIVVAAIVNGLHITTSNEFFSLLFSGDVLSITPGIGNVVSSIFIIIAVTLTATIIYPVGVALRIQPVAALDMD